MSKRNLLLLHGKALGSTNALKTVGWSEIWSIQCTYNHWRSGRRNVYSASKWQQEILLLPLFLVQESQKGSRPDKRVRIWIPLKMWRANSNVGSLRWGPASYFYIKNPFFCLSQSEILACSPSAYPANQLSSIPLGKRWLLVALWVICSGLIPHRLARLHHTSVT